MPNFAANISMMFNEYDFLDRFAAASKSGFKAVEFLFPYDYEPTVLKEKLIDSNLDLALAGGDNGLVEIWDYQNLKKLGTKRLNNGSEITAMRLDPTSGF